jgi:hypothetical protein
MLYAALATSALLLALLPFSASLERRFLANHHLSPPSTPSWIVIGLLPKMYGGRHETWLSPEPLGDYFRADLRRAPFDVVYRWVNHSPGRVLRLDTLRDFTAQSGTPTYVRLESSYGPESLTSTYRVRAAAGRLEVRTAP